MGGGPGSPAQHRVGFRGTTLGEPPCVLSTPSSPQPEPESLGSAAPGFPEQEEDELHRTLGVERFEEILQEAGSRGGEEPGRSYGEEDFECEGAAGALGSTVQQGRGWGGLVGGTRAAGEGRDAAPRLHPGPLLPVDHRQSSHHIHHPLSAHLPPDARRRKTPQGLGRKPRRRPGASPTGETPTIEEGEEDEDEASEAEGARALTQPSPASTPSSVQVSGGRAPGGASGIPSLASPALMDSCSSSFSRRMKAPTGRQRGPVHPLLHRCPTRRGLPGPAEGPRPGKRPQRLTLLMSVR